MSIEFNIDCKEFIQRMKNVKIACDNLEKAIAKYVAKNKHQIFRELIEENNKRMGGRNGIK